VNLRLGPKARVLQDPATSMSAQPSQHRPVGWMTLIGGVALCCTSNGGTGSTTDGPTITGQDTGAGTAVDARIDVDSGSQRFVDANLAGDANPAACPMARPTVSTDCPANASCSYGDVVCACYPSRVFLPDGGSSTRQTWGCAPLPPAPCPRSVPPDRSPCDREGLRCNYDVRPCAAGNPQLHVCEGGVWRLHATPCSSSGGDADAAASTNCLANSDCGNGRLCVAFVTNVGPMSTTTRQCRPNPCAAAQLSCSCAGTLCSAPTSICAVQGDRVICDDGRQ
jgi:hypothetical protein